MTADNSVLWYPLNIFMLYLFRNACIDSYRALVLHPTWEKPYYRCAEAWHRLGEISHAIDINDQGQVLCSSSVDLVSQINSFRASKSARLMLLSKT